MEERNNSGSHREGVGIVGKPTERGRDSRETIVRFGKGTEPFPIIRGILFSSPKITTAFRMLFPKGSGYSGNQRKGVGIVGKPTEKGRDFPENTTFFRYKFAVFGWFFSRKAD